MFFFREAFTSGNLLMETLAIFLFIVWFWLLIIVASDLFRRRDVSGWIKAIWVTAWIAFPCIAVLAYLIFQARGMAERNSQREQQAREDLRRLAGSTADEIEKLDWLKKRRIYQRRRIYTTARPARAVSLEAIRKEVFVRSTSYRSIGFLNQGIQQRAAPSGTLVKTPMQTFLDAMPIAKEKMG
jgi:hypothetical protein